MKVGCCSALLIVFVTLKLVGVIGWSWLWVLAPLWLPPAIALLAFGVLLWCSPSAETVVKIRFRKTEEETN